MELTEPVTALTDYLLAVVTAWLAGLLFRSRASHYSRGFWAIAFAALALAAALGGTVHGFEAELARATLFRLWALTLILVGVASCAMLAGSAFATTGGAVRAGLLAFGVVKLLGFAVWIHAHPRFVYAVVDTAISFAVVALLHLLRPKNSSSKWIVGGVVVSAAAAAVQSSGFALHRNLNHNDLYHLIQIAAMALYYRGVSRMEDAKRRND